MYGNAIRTVSTVDQFTHILPQAVYCITTPRYYFQGTTFISYWICKTVEASSGQECQFYISTVRAHIGTSTGRSTLPPLHQMADQLTWKSAHIGFWVCWLQCTMLELCVKIVFEWWWFFLILTGRFRHRVLKHGVGVEWDARRTAA